MASEMEEPSPEDEEEEQLGWSWKYTMICVVLPALQGLINAYAAGVMGLHYLDMGWPAARLSIPTTCGFLVRMLTQQIQLRLGFWSAIPVQILHLGFAINGLILSTEEWAVALEITSMVGLDVGIVVEGLSFHEFGYSEDMARQASSTVLAVFTMCVASGVSFGGIVYDLAGWQGCSVYHVSIQSLLIVILLFQPALWVSLREFLTPKAKPRSSRTSKKQLVEEKATSIVPSEPGSDLGVSSSDIPAVTLPGAIEDDRPASPMVRQLSPVPDKSDKDKSPSKLQNQKRSRRSEHSKASSQRSSGSAAHRSRRLSRFTMLTAGTHNTHFTGLSRLTAGTARSKRTNKTNQTVGTMLSRITNMKDSDNYQHHFATHTILRPTIVQQNGMEDSDDDSEYTGEEEEEYKGIPKDVRLPVAYFVLAAFNNNFCYPIEYVTFALFFKEYHGWESATWASLAQTAGDLVAAIMMKVLPNDLEQDNPEAGFFRKSMRQPYNVAWLLVGWILCNAGMISPWLPMAITAQVIMGTIYVYTSKALTDLTLFYSMGDTKVFLEMQVYCRNFEAIAGCSAAFLALLLYDTVSPFAPFMLSTGVSLACFMIYTLGFCRRLGVVDDIDSAEARRSRRLGVTRVSKWSMVSRKTQLFDEEEAENVHAA